MIPEERRNKIIDFIKSNQTATIPEISKNFNISEITVRRDFNILSKKGVIKKVYGGATMSDSISQEPYFLKRIDLNIEHKQKIAAEAIKRINDGDTILLESGSTCLELVKLLEQKKNLNVITAAPHIVNVLCNLKRDNRFNGEIFCCGGVWRGEPDDLFVGPHALDFFDSVRINASFFGLLAVNLEDGWMAPSIYEVDLTRKIISASEKIIGIADSSKFNKKSFTKIGPLSLFYEIITDNGLSGEDIKKYGNEVNLTVV